MVRKGAQEQKRPRGRPRGPATPAAAAVARRNGRKNRAKVPPDPAAQPRDELDAIRRQFTRLDAEAEALYAAGSRVGRRERAKELRAIARAMGALVPKARLRRAELVVRGEAAEIAASGKDAPMEPVPPDGKDEA